ncbi:MAG: MFS transporter [Anaerolineales bacterium]|nr:MFS transporter [Anaerolineales bacterium]
MFAKIKSIYREYPKAFWVYNIIVFIDRFGGFMLFPFFAPYLTKKFDLSMSTVGIIFGIFSASGFIGNVLGGALTDRVGRKGIIVFSLALSSLSALGMGFAPTIDLFIIAAVIVGTLSSIGGPAQEAVVADLLPEGKRAEGYGIIRVVFNLAVIISPAVAGALIAKSYTLLFIVDAVISVLAAGVVIFFLPETKPMAQAHAKPESMAQTFAGYGKVFKDVPFIAYIAMTALTCIIYMNFNTTLGVFLRDQHGIPEIGYGYLISMNAVIVALFQFWVARKLEKYRPMLMVALGAGLYGLGFAMYGFTSTYFMFAVAMIIITIGEMTVSPFHQALVANFAPKEMRGRYMAIAGLSWTLGLAIGPYIAGVFLDSPSPNWLWYACGLLGIVNVIGYVVLDKLHHAPAELAAEAATAH